ncbi:MAG: hypothetical protein Q8P81_03485 [Nanoarchaeota archaeon]|nr:hypothetical protein [Nanoarchaeota archaeon]
MPLRFKKGDLVGQLSGEEVFRVGIVTDINGNKLNPIKIFWINKSSRNIISHGYYNDEYKFFVNLSKPS